MECPFISQMLVILCSDSNMAKWVQTCPTVNLFQTISTRWIYRKTIIWYSHYWCSLYFVSSILAADICQGRKRPLTKDEKITSPPKMRILHGESHQAEKVCPAMTMICCGMTLGILCYVGSKWHRFLCLLREVLCLVVRPSLGESLRPGLFLGTGKAYSDVTW